MKKIVFFNNKGGVGKTTLVYHLSWMMAELGYNVLSVDFDPQCNLSSMFLSQERMEEVFIENPDDYTILESIKPLTKGIGDIKPVHIESITDNINLIIGNLELSTFEDKLSDAWTKCINRDESAFRIVSSFYRIIEEAAKQIESDIVLVDVGPNLGAINRAVLIAGDYVVLPVTSDLFSLQGIKNLGTTFKLWSEQWQDRYSRNPEPSLNLPPIDGMQPIGYVLMQHGVKESRPVKAYLKWANRIPKTYQEHILVQETSSDVDIAKDKNCLGLLKHYRSLMPMAMEANKPIFLLKPADGAIGAHYQAVQRCYEDFKELSESILSAIDTIEDNVC
jgi:cellulose biosynthesis protein BcsQ